MSLIINNVQLIDIPKIIAPNGSGNLSVIEKDIVPFDIKRVYYLYDVPSDSKRGGHAHLELKQFLVALSGSFDVHLDDGVTKSTITWRELDNFSSGSVCLSVVSNIYKESDYIRAYSDFKKWKSNQSL